MSSLVLTDVAWNVTGTAASKVAPRVTAISSVPVKQKNVNRPVQLTKTSVPERIFFLTSVTVWKMAYVISHVQEGVVKIWNALTHRFITIHVNRVALVSILINNSDTVEAILGTLFLLYTNVLFWGSG